MSRAIPRRTALAVGMVSTGALLGTSCSKSQEKQSTSKPAARTNALDRKPFWDPGPDKNLTRDLTSGTTPVRLGAFMNRNGQESLTEMVKRFRENGTTGTMANVNTWISASDSEVNEFTAALKRYDVVVFEVPGYTNMIHPDSATRQKNLKNLATCIEAAERIGCPMVGTISGSCDPVYGFNVHPDNWTEETWNLLVRSMKQVLRDTEGMKACIGMEAQITTNIDDPKAHRRLIDDVGPRCTVNLDPTNMISLSTYYHTTELLNECFDLLGESILGCHAKDTYIWPDKQTVHVQEVCPGRGVMDYETFLVRMSRMKWPRTICPEHLPDEQYPEAQEYIRKVADKVGVKIYG